MSNVDWSAIRTAIAARCATGTGIASATASEEGLVAIGSLPAVKVLTATSIEINPGRGGRVGANAESRSAPIVGLLLVDSAPGDGIGLWRVEPLVEQMFAVIRTGHKLGLGTDYVEDCWLERADIGEVDFNGDTFIGAVLTWIVRVRQTDFERTA